VKPAETPVARQQIRNTHLWTNWKAVFSTRSVRYLRDETIEALLGEVFSVRSVSRCYKQAVFYEPVTDQ
jgi:hypothetical protein